MHLLFVIPARGGSKGIPGKNIKPLLGKPLIQYSIEYARLFSEDDRICVTTDSEDIVACAAQINLEVPFIRPDELASDTAGTFEVLQHSLSYYDQNGQSPEAVVLLQPTSPIREKRHLEEALKLYDGDADMVVSVKISKANPYYNLFEEDDNGYMRLSKGETDYTRRQDAPPVYEYNGSIYIINPASLRSKKSFQEFKRVIKYIMNEKYSLDLDTPNDWDYASFLLIRSG
jgi:N-acylneuraminate cytidylyltransferase